MIALTLFLTFPFFQMFRTPGGGRGTFKEMCPGTTRAGCNRRDSCQRMHTDDKGYLPSTLPFAFPGLETPKNVPSFKPVGGEQYAGAVPAEDMSFKRAPQVQIQFKEWVKVLPSPSDLALAAKKLMACAKACDSLRNYRLELLWTNNAWSITIFIDPLFWYDKLLTGTLAEKIQIARSWIGRAFPEWGYRDTSVVEVISPDFRDVCKDECYKCSKVHPSAKCFVVSSKVKGEDTACGWFACGELVVKPYCSPGWVVQVRPVDRVRELLLLPRPPQHFDSLGKRVNDRPPGYWSGHYTNDELVIMPAFWEKACDLVSTLRKYDAADESVRVALNFGGWETQASRDEYSVACHGHAHIIFSSIIFEALCAKNSGIVNLEVSKPRNPLVGRGGDPEDYNAKNREDLSSRRVVIDGQASMEQKISELDDKFESLATKVEDSMSEIKQLMMTVLQNQKSGK